MKIMAAEQMKRNRYIVGLIKFLLKMLPPTAASRQFMKPSGLFGRHVMTRLFEIGNAKLLKFMVSFGTHDERGHILDIGFGPGNLFEALMAMTPHGRVYGIDFSPDMVEGAERRYRRSIDAGRLEVKCASIENIPYGEGHFDAVYTANTIYFWPDPERNLLEVKRVLKKNGTLIIGFRTREQMSRLPLNLSLFREFSGEDIQSMMQRAGFNRVEIRHRKEKELDSWCVVGHT